VITIIASKERCKFKKKLELTKKGNYTLIGEYKGSHTKNKFRHNVCGYEWYTTPNNLLHTKDPVNGGCPKCQYDKKSISLSDFARRVKTITNGEYELDGNPVFTRTYNKAGFVHKKCGSHFIMTAESIMFNTTSCPNCFNKCRRTPINDVETFCMKLKKRWGDEYVLANKETYKGIGEKVSITHTLCGTTWSVRAYHILKDSGCPKCIQSKGERVIHDILVSHGILFKEQYKFKDCVYKKELPFDFAIVDHNYSVIGLIEYDGVQHFMSFNYFGGEEGFRIRNIRDSIKTNYCCNKDIPLLRVEYTKSYNEILNLVTSFYEKIGK